MSEIRPLSEADFEAFVDIFANAYPAMLPSSFGSEDKTKLVERWKKGQTEPDGNLFYGCFRNDILVGGMQLYDFTMNIYGNKVNVSGVGQICVDLAHKKEHVAKDLVEYYLRHYQEKGVCLALLYPFRPDFYRKMGWGYGVKMNQYHFRPKDLQKGGKTGVDYLNESDVVNVTSCFNRYVQAKHGMIFKKKSYFERMLQRGRVIGYRRDGRVEGFISFGFKKLYNDHFLLHDIIIRDFVYENPKALSALLTFLHVQLDQVNRIVFETQDPDFHWLIHDPRNGEPNIFKTSQESNVQGLGVMYRVIDTKLLFQSLNGRNFNDVSIKVKINLADSFLPPNNRAVTVYFKNGYATLVDNGESDVEISVDVSEFSSMIMGVVDFQTLYSYGLAKIGDKKYLHKVDNLFKGDKPITIEQF